MALHSTGHPEFRLRSARDSSDAAGEVLASAPMLNLMLLVLAALVVWAVFAFNLLIRDRNRVAQSWSDVDVQLMRRHDLVPRLVELVKGYSGYEKAVQT